MKGNTACNLANTLMNLSSAPKITLGRKTVNSKLAVWTAACKTFSPRALLRWYIDAARSSAPKALICTKRCTPSLLHAATRWRISCTCTWSKAVSLPCKMATRLTTASCPRTRDASCAGSCTSARTISTPGNICTLLAGKRLVGTVMRCPCRLNASQTWRPTKPLPPKTKIFCGEILGMYLNEVC